MKIIHLKMIKNRINKIMSEDKINLSDKGELEYWKSKVFSILSLGFLICGAPSFCLGAYMFYIQGDTKYAIIEILLYIVGSGVIIQKSLTIKFKKVFIILALYCMSLLLLISTGTKGAGMVCVVFSLVLTGCLLSKKQVIQVVIINYLIFGIITLLLMKGYLDGTPIEAYKKVWLINVIATQTCGILLIIIMSTIYSGLDGQNKFVKKSRELISASEIKHKAMISNISDIIVICDESGLIKYVSPNVKERYGLTVEDMINKPLTDNVHTDDRQKVKIVFSSLLQKDSLTKTFEARYFTSNNKIKYLEFTAVNLIIDKNIDGILINIHDITERKLKEEKILYLNYHDSLTGLYNRTFFELEKVRLDKDYELPLSVIVGDINGLKIINDSLGHTEGDKIILVVSEILNNCCNHKGIISRIGGDEFGMLLPQTSEEEAYAIVEKVNRGCEEHNNVISSKLKYTSISLGVATKTNISESLDGIFKVAEDYMYKRKLLESRSLHSSILASMKATLFAKSQETEEHAQRLVKLSKEVGEAIGLTSQEFDDLELFSSLHDIGKIGIDDRILNKPGKLSEEEWCEMKKHTEIGYRIAMSSPELVSIAYYILTHHERWDGNGYPQGLVGENIPLLSRIVAVVDTYDAMTEDRPYRKGMQKEEAIREIINNSGTQFDPYVVKIFVEIISKI